MSTMNLDYEYLFKLLLIGDSGVGKTCLTYRFCSGKFPSTPTDATIGVDFREKIITLDNNEQVYELNNFCNDFTFYKLFSLKLLYILFPYPYLIYIFILCFQVRLQLWDTAGQERFRRSMVAHYYRNVAAVVLVYDVTRKDTFDALEHWVAVSVF